MISELRDVDASRLLAGTGVVIEPGSAEDRARLAEQEWLLTDGLGGFAMGTVGGVPTRRYHGLLIASRQPPLRRVLALHSLNEVVWVHPDDPRCRPVDLTSSAFADGTRLEGGSERLVRFELMPGGANEARWTYDLGNGGRLIKRLMLHELASAASVRYEASGVRAWIEVRPLLGLRDFHGLNADEDGAVRVTHAADDRSLWVARHDLETSLELTEGTGGSLKVGPHWWHGLRYEHEADRGFECVEQLFSPGSVHLGLHEPAGLRVVLGEPGSSAGRVDDDGRSGRLRGAIEASVGDSGESADDGRVAALAVAADQFVVRRAATPELARAESSLVTIIAGYPWFGDWGRDSMIALPGLLLATGRFDEAARVLETFAGAQRDGLVPNRFADDGGEPEYNTADASLWFLHACCAFHAAAPSGPEVDALMRDVLVPACLDVVEGYMHGALGGIGVDAGDGLVFAGDESTQLTWMDAARDGVVFTPRHGKPIELQALWCHGLRSLAAVVEGWDRAVADGLRERAERTAASTRDRFWSDRLGCFMDCLRPIDGGGWEAVEEIRPNQLFACSLEHGPADSAQRASAVRVCLDRLWTPHGMRTLDPADANYRGRYAGPMMERDAAYHTGTAWPWLLGPMAEAVLRAGAFSAESCRAARGVVAPMIDAMLGTDAPAPGQMFEVYDGDTDQQRPGGCPAQAWSVSEALRVLTLVRRAEASRVV
ncbi:MAG: amylo-alpha-1,6-glucosidase [Planctomycetota bacterium]